MNRPSAYSEVPKEWKIVKIEDVIEDYQNGYAFSAKEYTKKGLPIVSMSSISLDGRFQFSYENCKFWDESKKEDLKKFLLKKGDVIIAMTDVTPNKNLIGRMALVSIDDSFLLNQRVGLFRLKNAMISNEFLAYLGNSDSWIYYCQNISSQGAQANIGTKDIKRSNIPLPPLPEQQKIADILSTLDEKIMVIDHQITATEELKKGLMQRLLTKGIGHTEFKDSPLGKIPMSWEVKKFKDIAFINSDSLTSTNKELKSYKYIDLSSVKNGVIDLNLEEISFDNLPSRAKRLVKKGDVLLATVRPNLLGYGIIDFETNEYLCSTGFAVLTSRNQNSSMYLYQYLYSELLQKQIFKLIVGSNYPAINSSDVANLQIPVPSSDEQKEIAEILSKVDVKLQTQKDKKQAYHQLKKGLMQQLLTGKIRVNNLIEA